MNSVYDQTSTTAHVCFADTQTVKVHAQDRHVCCACIPARHVAAVDRVQCCRRTFADSRGCSPFLALRFNLAILKGSTLLVGGLVVLETNALRFPLCTPEPSPARSCTHHDPINRLTHNHSTIGAIHSSQVTIMSRSGTDLQRGEALTRMFFHNIP